MKKLGLILCGGFPLFVPSKHELGYTLGVMMRRFYLNRSEDKPNVSGTGKVLEGVLTESGRVFVEWTTPYKTIGIYDSLEQFVALHVQLPHVSQMIWQDE